MKSVTAQSLLFCSISLIQTKLSDLLVVLASIEQICRNLETSITAPELLEQIKKKVDRAGETITVLNGLVRQDLVLNHEDESLPPKISWKSWIRLHRQVQTLSKRIRDARQDITMDLTLLTA